MDNLLKRLKEAIMGLHQKIGVLNRPQNQFIWAKKEVREFESRLCISGFAGRKSLADC